MRKKSILVLFVSIVILFSCNSDQKQTSTDSEKQKETELISPAFDADRAFAYTKAQVDFGPRIPST